jgi:hypothetical protein
MWCREALQQNWEASVVRNRRLTPYWTHSLLQVTRLSSRSQSRQHKSRAPPKLCVCVCVHCGFRCVQEHYSDNIHQATIALTMTAVSTSETSVNIHQTTRRNIPEDGATFILVAVRTWNLTTPQILFRFYYGNSWTINRTSKVGFLHTDYEHIYAFCARTFL